MSVLGMIGAGAATLLAALWIVISFSAPGRRRTVLEWFATLAMYGVLITIMGSGLQRFSASDSHVLTITFGCLVAFFSSGFVVALTLMVRDLRSGGKSGASADATH